MEPLVQEFTKGNYRYSQIHREGRYAIFTQTHLERPSVVRYELIRIRDYPAHTWPTGKTTPAHEAYPPESQWGTAGWTCFTLAEAQGLLADLLARHGQDAMQEEALDADEEAR